MLKVANRLLVVVFLSVVILLFVIWPRLLSEPLGSLRWSDSPVDNLTLTLGNHPIDNLIREAQTAEAAKLATQTFSLNDTARAYRERRGRNPPPGFEAWWKYAQERDAIFVEEFWDQIYEDLDPFWGIDAATLRLLARSNADKGGEHTILLRNGEVKINTDWFWTIYWKDLFETMVNETKDNFEWPDMNIRANSMDESRLSVPWEVITGHLEVAQKTKRIVPKDEVVSSFSPAEVEIDVFPEEEEEWGKSDPYYSLITQTCPPDSPARLRDATHDFSQYPQINLDTAASHLRGGFVSNYTKSKLICHQPDVLDLNMALIHPSSQRVGSALIPLFGGSKLSCNSEILLPAPLYWHEEEQYTATEGKSAWDAKSNNVTWRGVASGGIHDGDSWRHQHRLRFMAFTNSSLLDVEGTPPNFILPPTIYNLPSPTELARWSRPWLNTGFTWNNCVHDDGCPYLDPYFSQVEGIPLNKILESKYLPDIDGQSFSGRFRTYLSSASVPIKATLYKEWHDSRLTAWVHFVPMDNRFVDFYGIMDYFLGFVNSDGVTVRQSHDDVAEMIGWQGRTWSKRVLRREDMAVYTFRLMLEYARVLDEKREILGWVGDL